MLEVQVRGVAPSLAETAHPELAPEEGAATLVGSEGPMANYRPSVWTVQVWPIEVARGHRLRFGLIVGFRDALADFGFGGCAGSIQNSGSLRLQ